jgi:hypothetical protein
MPRARPSSKADIAARKAAARRFSGDTVAVPIGGPVPTQPPPAESGPGTAFAEPPAVEPAASRVRASAPGGSDAEAARVETLLDRIAEIAHVGGEQRPEFLERVKVCLWRYEVEKRQNQQEHPKRQIAAYKPIAADARRLLQRLRSRSKRLRRSRRATARRLLKWLRDLPEGLRLPLGAGNTETGLVYLIGATGTRFVAAIDNVEPQLDELLGNTELELAKLRRQATAGRPPASAALHLQQGLRAAFAECGPVCPHAHASGRRGEKPAKARRCEPYLDCWTAKALDELGVAHSNPKKNPRRFRGRKRQT